MRRGTLTALAAVSLLPASSCFVEVVEGSGVAETERRELDPFTTLLNTTFLDVTLSIAAEQAVEVSCDDNLLEFLETSVSAGGELLLRQRIKGDDPNSYVSIEPQVDCGVTIAATTMTRVTSEGSGALGGAGAFDALSGIVNRGSGALALQGIEVDALEISLEDVGGITVSGSVAHLSVASSSAGAVRARELPAADADVLMSGAGDVELRVSGCLNALVEGEGSLYVSGGALLCEVEAPGAGQVVVE
jgi:hypothetical protein